MSLEGSFSQAVIFPADGILFIIKVSLLTLSVLYFIFTLIVVRQVNMMTETLITEVAPVIQAFAILNAGIGLGVIILFIGLLFG